MNAPFTSGVHHVGLSVSKLEESAKFFTELLGWKEVRRKEEYPAIFVSDGSIMLTLWETKGGPVNDFNRKTNVGLHHLALSVATSSDLELIHKKLVAKNVKIDFSPEDLGPGPARHMMCFEPSGIRVEFTWPGK